MNSLFRSRTHSRRSAGVLLLVGVLAGVTVGGGVGVIAASSTKTVTVCADKKTNMLRYVKNGKCANTETKVELNQTGVAGAKGDTGLSGTNGAKGDTGAAGTNGTNATLAIAQQSVCDGSDVDTIANELCKIGMTGPGGGLIFFVDYNNEYATYDYLEAAPADGVFASGAANGPWATTVAMCGSGRSTNCLTGSIYTETLVALATARGSHRGLFGGMAATAAIVARHATGSVASNLYAAGVADEYAVNGKSDWWLPTKDELGKMEENLNNKGVGGFTSGSYWSSSESSSNTVMYQSFNYGGQDYQGKDSTFYVRPVRGF